MSAVSFSQISKFRTCPRQFQASYVTKEVEFQSTEATRWGIAVHLAFEERLRDKKPFPDTMSAYEGDAQLLEALEGELTVEHRMTINKEGQAVEWGDSKAEKRGILDVWTNQGSQGIITDWKSGKYSNPRGQYATMYKGLPIGELDYFALLAFNIYPELEKIKTIYRWLKLDAPPSVNIITREQLPILTEGFDRDIEKIEEAKVYDKFIPKRGGLCRKWCPVVNCKFQGY